MSLVSFIELISFIFDEGIKRWAIFLELTIDELIEVTRVKLHSFQTNCIFVIFILYYQLYFVYFLLTYQMEYYITLIFYQKCISFLPGRLICLCHLSRPALFADFRNSLWGVHYFFKPIWGLILKGHKLIQGFIWNFGAVPREKITRKSWKRNIKNYIFYFCYSD